MIEPLRPHSVILSVLSRYVHCGSSTHSAVRIVVDALWESRKQFLALPKTQRRFAIASIIYGHARNVAEYRNVMGGTNRVWVDAKNPFVFDTETQNVSILKGQVAK